MGETTGIAWTDHTFNPWIGCTKVHEGCRNCYAETLATTRMGRQWGVGAERRVTSESNWKLPGRWARAAGKAQVRRRVFCASLADVLDEEAPKWAQDRLWEVIRQTARVGLNGEGTSKHLGAFGLDWQLLTKRPERWEIIPEDVRPLVWLGTSISDQKTHDKYGAELLKAEGFRLLFYSYEPGIGPVDLRRECAGCPDCTATNRHIPLKLGWVIVGGESGKEARPFAVEWAASVISQCRNQVPVFHKQLGSNPYTINLDADDGREWLVLRDKKGGDPSEWPPELRVREFPKEMP